MSSTNKHSLREILEAIIVLYTERKLGESRSVSIKTEERGSECCSLEKGR